MEALTISKKRFESLQPLSLQRYILHTESELYIIPKKHNYEKEDHLLKRLYVTNGDYFSNKLYTINSLLDNETAIDIEELILPEQLAIVNNSVVGFVMPLVESENLKTVLRSNKYTPKQKIQYLKQVGEIIEKVKKVRTYKSKEHPGLSDFYLNDIHENNFILDKNRRVKAVDIDSCKINNNKTFPSKYLRRRPEFENLPKYQKIENSLGAQIETSENTEIYCYIIMILNFLYGGAITKLEIEEFYDYLEYLHHLGMPFEIVDMFSNIYTNHENISPIDALDDLESFTMRSKESVYKLARKYDKI